MGKPGFSFKVFTEQIRCGAVAKLSEEFPETQGDFPEEVGKRKVRNIWGPPEDNLFRPQPPDPRGKLTQKNPPQSSLTFPLHTHTPFPFFFQADFSLKLTTRGRKAEKVFF